MSVADNISFNNFCQLCMKISEATYDKKLDILQNYIESWKKKAQELKKTQPSINDSFFPVLRFLLPQLDRERGAYGVKEHTLAKIYIRILSLPKDGRDAMKFLEYRAPKTSGGKGGDFAEVAFWILKKRCAGGCQLSIEEINNHLDAIAAKHASNEPRGVDSEIISLLKESSAEEQKWLIRIILKEMKLGLGQNAILKCFHPDARELYDATNDLKKVCNVLRDLKVRLNEIEIELFSPLKPMLSEECNFLKLDAYLKRSRYFYIETKLDGERFQLHMKEGNFKYFSRNGFEFTSNFGANRNEGVLTPRLADRFLRDVKCCILDGEMMSWDPKTGKFASKANNIDVKSLKETSVHQPCFCVFDVLLYNDEILTNKPLITRLEILNEIVNPLEGAICFVSRKRISSKDEVVECLNDAIDNREEGLVMKEFMSVYKPNVRNNGGWFKIKPEYIDGLADTLDLLIIGGYYGSGRHKRSISHFLLGVAVDDIEGLTLFYSVARVGSGYSMDELLELQTKLQPHWNVTIIGEMPPCIEWAKEKPDVWIEPNKSFVLEVKAAEITSSHLFKTQYTLRFPRVVKVRYDKSWKDSLTLEQFEEKRKMAAGKLATHHLTSSDTEIVVPKKKPRSNLALGAQFKGIDAHNTKCVLNLLEGKEICVFTGFEEVKKSEVERKIIEYGGTLVQNPGKKTFCVLAETDSTVRIKNLIKCESQDLIRTSWFFSQLTPENNQFPEFHPENYLAMSKETREFFSKYYDKYGDSYKVLSTKDSLSRLIMNAKNKFKEATLTVDEKFNLDMELFCGPSPHSLFRCCTAYFDSFPILENPSSGLLPHLEISQFDFKFGSGTCSELISDDVTHVVISKEDLSRIKEINLRNRQRKRKFHIVSDEWIKSSLMCKTLLEENDFQLNQ